MKAKEKNSISIPLIVSLMIGGVMFFGLIVAILIFFAFSYLSEPSDTEIYDEAIYILETELAQPENLSLEYTPIEFTTIEKTDKNTYQVSGNVYDEYDQTAKYTIHLFFRKDGSYNYEWIVDGN